MLHICAIVLHMSKKYQRVNLVFNEGEYQELDKKAINAGVTVSKFIKDMLHKSVTLPSSSNLMAEKNSAERSVINSGNHSLGSSDSHIPRVFNDGDLDADGFPIEKVENMYKGWKVCPDPDGLTTGWFDESVNKKLKVITNGKREVRVYEDDPIYNLF